MTCQVRLVLATCSAVLLAGTIAGCGTARGAEPAAAARTPASLRARIEAEIGKPTCSSDAQCRSLPVGHKACGGPEGWLPWSTAVSDETRLRELAEAYARQRRDEQAARGMVSDCAMVRDPGAVCRQGMCVSGGAGSESDPGRPRLVR